MKRRHDSATWRDAGVNFNLIASYLKHRIPLVYAGARPTNILAYRIRINGFGLNLYPLNLAYDSYERSEKLKIKFYLLDPVTKYR